MNKIVKYELSKISDFMIKILSSENYEYHWYQSNYKIWYIKYELVGIRIRPVLLPDMDNNPIIL